MPALLAALALLGATNPPDPRAADATEAFMDLCLRVAAHPGPAATVLDGRPEIARKLDPATLERLFGPAAAKITDGWMSHSPRDAWFALAFAPSIRSCSVLVREVDATALTDAVTKAVTAEVAAHRAKVAESSSKRIEVDGVPATEMIWRIDGADGSRSSVIASVGDRPFGNKQALMTYSLLHIGPAAPAK